jgi:iron complex outermembrane receptor protein
MFNALLAQDGQLKDLSLEELLNFEVTTASSVKEKQSEAPATVYVITARDIEQRGYMSILEVLEDVPEFELHLKSHSEYHNVVTTRGLTGQEHLLILVDGARYTSPGATLHNIDENINIRYVERIEIVMGPASAVYGADAFAGVINIITYAGDARKGIELTTSYGMYNTQNHALRAGFGTEDLSVAIYGSFYNSAEPNLSKFYKDDYRWYNEQFVPNSTLLASPFFNDTIPYGRPSEWGNSKTAYSVGAKFNIRKVELGALRSSVRFSTNNSIRPEYTVYDDDHFYEINNLVAYGKYRYESLNKKFSLEPLFTFTSYEVGPQSNFNNSFSGYNKAYKYAFNNAFQANLIGSWTINNASKLSGGVTYKFLNALPKTSDMPFAFDRSGSPDAQGIYYIGTNTVDTTGRDVTEYQNFYYFNETTLGGFAQYQANVQDIMFFTVGGRFDYNSRYGITLNPRLGLVVKPLENFRMRLSYGEAFLAPSPEKAFDHYGSMFFNESSNQLESFFFRLPNPDLQPEKIRSGEVNFSYNTSILSYTLGAYFNGVTDIPDAVFNPDTVFFAGAAIINSERNENIGTESSYGGTFRVDYRQIFNENFSINAYAFYSLTTGVEDEAGIDYTSFHNIKSGASINWGNFTISPRVVWRSGGYIHGETRADQVKVPASTLVNLYLSYRVVQPQTGPSPGRFTLDVFLRVRNALNLKYYNVGAFTQDSFNATPQDPIRISGGVSLRFGPKPKR